MGVLVPCHRLNNYQFNEIYSTVILGGSKSFDHTRAERLVVLQLEVTPSPRTELIAIPEDQTSTMTAMTSTALPPSFPRLPLEIIAEIPSHLPLVCRPAASISLALTCRSFCTLMIPSVLYRVVWLEGESRALCFLSRFNGQLSHGGQVSRHIRHLAVTSGLSAEVRQTNVLQELRMLVSAGGLRNLVALTLHLEDGWYCEPHTTGGEVDGELSGPFWDALARNCPLISHIHLTGISDYPGHEWIATSGVFDFKVSL
jgi:hypothetical protein